MSKSETPEDKGIDLLAMWQATGDVPLKFAIAPDVQPGDAVYLDAETECYQKVTKGSPFHGIFDGYAVIIFLSINDKELFLRHSLIDGQMTPGAYSLGEE